MLWKASVNNKDFEFGGKKIKIKQAKILANNQKVNKSKSINNNNKQQQQEQQQQPQNINKKNQ